MAITKLLMELLEKPLAIWLGCLKTTAKPLVIATQPSGQTALQSHLTKVGKLRKPSHWLTSANSLVMLVLAVSGTTYPVKAADLLATYHAAQSQDAVFAAAQAAHRAGLEKLPQGVSLLLPSVNLSANNTFNDSANQYSGANAGFYTSNTVRFDTLSYGVNLTQPLFHLPNWVIYTEAGLQVAQADAQLMAAEQDLVVRVAQAYFNVLIAQNSVQLAEAQKIAITEQLEQAKRNFEVGTATITDTLEAQASYDLVSSQKIAAQSDMEIKKRTLQQLTNAMPDNLRQLGQQFKLEELPTGVEKWVDEAQLHNPQLAVAQISAELAEKEVVRNRGGHYPTLDLIASYSENYASGGLTGVSSGGRNTSVGVQLNMPLYQGGATQSKVREAEANRDRAKDDLENTRRTITLQVHQAYLGVVNGIAQVKALQQALKSSESLLDASKLGQEVGVRTNLDVLNAQKQLFSTRRDLYQAEYSYLTSQLQLKAAVGTLSENDLAMVNQALY